MSRIHVNHRTGERFIVEDCSECDEEIQVPVTYGPCEGEDDYQFPDNCPHCGHDLTNVGETDLREDFHSDI